MIPRAVRSPCVQVCTMDQATGWCLGCFRTIEEIASWTTLTDVERDAVWAALPARKAVVLQREAAMAAETAAPDAAAQK